MNNLKKSLVGCCFGLLVAGQVSGGTTPVDASGRGYVNSIGGVMVGNTFAGRGGEKLYQSFFQFDLAVLPNEVHAATLELSLELFAGWDPLETIEIFQYSGDPLNPVFEPLIGDILGQTTVTRLDVGSVLNIPLSSEAVNRINSNIGGMLTLGVQVVSPFGRVGLEEWEGVRFSPSWSAVGGDYSGYTHRLVVENPEPGEYAMMTAGLMLMAAVYWRRRRASA